MASIDDLWDTPAEPSTPRKRSSPIPIDDDDEPAITQRPAKRQALFLADSDDDEPIPALSPKPSRAISRAAIDGMFDLDEDDPAMPAGGDDDEVMEILRKAKATNARSNEALSLTSTPHAIMSSSPPREEDEKTKEKKGDGQKARKKIARMDETRLVGQNGFPALIQSTKGFVPKGKGHEAEDLNRLLQVYQFWTHKMYPKTQFKDTVATVEKLCHSRRMHVNLGVWRDEEKGLINGKKPEEVGDRSVLDLTSDAEPASSPTGTKAKPPQSSSPASDHDMDMELEQPTRPPSSGTDFDDDEGAFDMDALLKEQEEEDLQRLRVSAAAASARVAPKQTEPMADDEMDALWAELDAPSASALSASALPPPPRAAQDEDDEMWDIMHDHEPEATPWVPPSAPVMEEAPAQPEPEPGAAGTVPEAISSTGSTEKQTQPAAESRPTNDDDWDDMYQ